MPFKTPIVPASFPGAEEEENEHQGPHDGSGDGDEVEDGDHR